MEINCILKSINIKNNDIDSYITASFEIDPSGLDLTELNEMKHQPLTMQIDPSEVII